MAFTKVAVIGVSMINAFVYCILTRSKQAGGNLGKHFVQSLLASTEPKFEITVLARPSSSYTAPTQEVKVIQQDLSDHEALVGSLRGKEALVLMQGKCPEFESLSKGAIEAAIVAGVKVVIPSDYGG